jgi:predicted Zn-dependent peptidase
VFKGAGDRSAQDIVEVIESQGGQINAATGYERTSFQVRCLKGGLPLAMDVLSDLVRRPTITEADLEQEKGVIGQEIAEAADQPDDRVFDLAQSRAFAGQALGRPILGEPESIGPATPETLRAYHAALYDPSRIVVSAAGAVDEDELLALAQAAFGDARSTPDSFAPDAASFAGGATVEARKLEQAHLVLLLQGVSARDPDYFAMRLFAEALGGGMASRLFQVVREARGLAYAIDAYCENYEDVGLFGIYAGTSAADAAEAARLSAEQILELANQPSATELARAKAQLRSHLFMARESPLSRAEQAAGQLHLFDKLFTPESLAEAIDAVTLEDLRRVGGRLVTGASASAVLGPKKAGAAAETFQARLRA